MPSLGFSPQAIQLWQWLTEPHPQLESAEERRYARFLMFLMGVLGPLLWLATALLGPRYPAGISLFPFESSPLLLNASILFSYFLGYLLSRRGAYRLASYWVVTFFSAFIIALSFQQAKAEGVYGAMHYLALVILFSNIYLPLWGTLLALAFQCGLILALRLWQGPVNDGDLASHLMYTCVAVIFTSLIIHYYKRIENKRVSYWQESEESYRQLLHHSMSGVTIHDGRHILLANPMAAKIMGYEHAEDLVGISLAQIVHPDDAAMVGERIQARLRGEKTPNRYMLRILNRQGEMRWIETDAQRIFFHGQACIMANSIDLSDRIKAEKELRQRNTVLERLHRLALATASTFDWESLVQDIVQQFSYTIPNSTIYLRRYLPESQQSITEAQYPLKSPPPSVGEMQIPDALNQLQPQLLQEQSYFYWLLQASSLLPDHPYWERLQQQGVKTALFLPLLLKSKRIGTVEICHTEAEYHYTDEELDLLSSMANQTALAYDRVKVYLALENSERHNRLILNTLSGLILSQNRAGTYTHIIYDQHPIFPFAANTLLQHKPEQFFPEGISQLIHRHLAAALKSDHMQVFEYELNWGDEPAFYETRMVKSNEQEVLSLIRDITPAKQAVQQLLDLSIERERVKILENFISDASHDLRTPIANLKSRLYLMNKADTPEKRQRQLEVMEGEIDRLEKLIDDLLTMSHLDANIQDKTLREIHLNRLIADMLETYRSLAEKKNIQLDFHPNPRLPIIMGDEVALGRVLGNLLSNALNYTPQAGAIQIRTLVESGGVMVEVQDTGIGIAEDDLAHIFERFYRADKARNTDLGGTGLGLAIVKKIIELHEGRVEVKSQINEGALFRVWFPSPHLTPTVQP